jgi:hypothetical protein
VGTPLTDFVWFECQRRPQVTISVRADRSRGHHADNDVRLSPQYQALSKDRPVASKPLMP